MLLLKNGQKHVKKDIYNMTSFVITNKNICDTFRELRYSGIYLLRCITNGKVYIGQSQNIYQRIMEHRSRIKSTTKNYQSTRIYLAMKKYGAENFYVEVLEKVEDLSIIDDREQYYLDYFNSTNNKIGYNTCPVSKTCRGVKHSEEVRKRMGDSKRGKKLSDEAKRKIGLASLGRKKSPETLLKISLANKGRVVSEETKDKIRDANTPRFEKSRKRSLPKPPKLKRGVKKYDLEMNLLKEYACLYDADRDNNYPLGTISQLFSRNRDSRDGFIFKVSDPNIKTRKVAIRPVIQWDKDMNFIKEFNSVKEAEETMGYHHGKVNQLLHGKRKNTTDFLWQYKSTEEPNPNPIR